MGGLTAGTRILVTGSGGYIGRVLTRVLRERGHEVIGLDSGLFEGCDFGSGPTEDEIRTDVRDVTPEDLSGVDGIVHLAALSNDPLGDLDPALTHDVNTSGTLHLARAAKEAGVRRFVFASSCSIYGATGGDDLLDEDAPLSPVTAYAESKVRTEEALADLVDVDFQAVFMRNATAYGVSSRLRLDIVLNNLTAWAHTTGAIRLQSDGTSWRPLIHIEDISAAAATLLAAPDDKVGGVAYNIGSTAENHLVRDLATMVRHEYPSCDVTFAEGAGSDPRSYRVDFSRFAAAFPEHTFRWTAATGIAELASAYRAFQLDASELTGERFIRLGHLRQLLRSGAVGDDLRARAGAA